MRGMARAITGLLGLVLALATVGMSSAVEAIAARHMGMRVCDINCVTNMAAGVEDVELSPEDVEEIAQERKADFELLFLQLVERMSV